MSCVVAPLQCRARYPPIPNRRLYALARQGLTLKYRLILDNALDAPFA